jgi:predicted aminopeptidase
MTDADSALRRWVRVLGAAALGCLALGGCADLSYYWQAAGGQLDLLRRSRPIDDWLADPTADETLKALLRRARELRAFATQDLGLPDNGSFRGFADMQRPYLVWNVFAAPELSLTPKQWCFPVAGCVAYRGYFAETAARDLANRLSAAGLDTYVGGVPAYSTLGWFDDPIPSTVIAYPDIDLARLIFHELAHQVVYVPGDTTFNESFATAVERAGARRWAMARDQTAALEALEQALDEEVRVTALVLSTRAKLAAVYAGPDDVSTKRAAKQHVIDELRAAHARLAPATGRGDRYARWFAGPLNNAQIASFAAYTQGVPAFEALLAEKQGDFRQFYDEVRRLAGLPEAQRRHRLDELASGVPGRAASIPAAASTAPGG